MYERIYFLVIFVKHIKVWFSIESIYLILSSKLDLPYTIVKIVIVLNMNNFYITLGDKILFHYFKCKNWMKTIIENILYYVTSSTLKYECSFNVIWVISLTKPKNPRFSEKQININICFAIGTCILSLFATDNHSIHEH